MRMLLAYYPTLVTQEPAVSITQKRIETARSVYTITAQRERANVVRRLLWTRIDRSNAGNRTGVLSLSTVLIETCM